MKQKPLKTLTYWLTHQAHILLIHYLSYIFQDHLSKGSIAQSGLGPPTSTINKENAHRLGYRPIKWRHFLK